MDKLSERLTIHSQDCWLASLPDNDMVIGPIQMMDLANALREAAALARRLEEAPVGHVDQAVAADAVVVDELDLSDWRLRGQRVRLVREE